MPTELLIAVLGGLGAMLGWGFADLFAKKTIDEIGDVVSLVWGHLLGTLVFIGIILYLVIIQGQRATLPGSIADWLLIFFFGVLQAVVYLLIYKGFGKGQVALLNPVFASFTGIVAIISVGFFGEQISSNLLLALGIIFTGILLISMDTNAFRIKSIKFGNVPGLKEIGIATLLAALWTLMWDRFVGGKDWLTYSMFMYAFMTLFIVIVARFQQVKLPVIKKGMWKYLFLIGVCEAIAYASLSLGYSATSFTSVVALISGAFSLPTIIFARIFLKEKVAKIQTVGGLIIVAGIIILSLR